MTRTGAAAILRELRAQRRTVRLTRVSAGATRAYLFENPGMRLRGGLYLTRMPNAGCGAVVRSQATGSKREPSWLARLAGFKLEVA